MNQITGIDTASVAGNGKVDWKRVKGLGYRFVILRATYGIKPDLFYQANASAVLDAGLVLGAYHFWKPKQNPVDQARALWDTTRKLIWTAVHNVLPPIFDLEFPGGREASGYSKAEALDRATATIDAIVDRFGCNPILYTSDRVWRERKLGNPKDDRFVECPLWLARYKTPPVDPKVPGPWGADNWWLHQYQGDVKGSPGFPRGNIDLNRFKPMILGEKGPRVSWVQRRVLPNTLPDGVFGKGTDSAVRVYQKNRNLTPDGVIGPVTFARLAWENA